MQPNDSTPDTLVDRREYLRLTGALAAGATAGLAGCADRIPGSDSDSSNDGSGSSTGLLSTAVSDDPGDIGDFESCIVTLDGIWVGPKTDSGDDESDTESTDEDGEETDDGDGGNTTEQDDEGNGPPEQASGNGNSSSGDTVSGSQSNETDDDPDSDDADDTDDEDGGADDDDDETDGENEAEESDADDSEDDSGGRTYYGFDEPQEADLTQLQGDAQQLVGEHELEVATYQFLQLDIAGISGTLTDGSEAEVDTPGNAPLKFNQSFDVREGYRTTFLADFTPVRRGNGSYLFKPVATETEVSYQKIESDGSGETDGGNTTDGNGTTGGNTTDGGNTTTDGGNTSDGSGSTGGNTTDGNTTDDGNTTNSSGS